MGVQLVRSIMTWSRGLPQPEQILIPTQLYRQADALKDPDLK